ncbi:hypothetical protein D9758_011742 [Tetrapyrgos nigripes]|uniref:Uncharacterized protein n=1 Tax=Tetrapyrgos nigripes TaxID=182062 RepID=A0A8H5GD26_9AGAR|nr:hypothetical protein D9758_011742 [Tetrapyrgos nigripes]
MLGSQDIPTIGTILRQKDFRSRYRTIKAVWDALGSQPGQMRGDGRIYVAKWTRWKPVLKLKDASKSEGLVGNPEKSSAVAAEL